MAKVINMCGGMKFMNPTEEMSKRRCICNYGECEANMSISVSLDDLRLIIAAVKEQLDNAEFSLDNRFKNHPNKIDDVDQLLMRDISRMTRLLNELEKLRE